MGMYKKPGAYLTGTASIANGGITVTGVGTLFTSELNNGSYVNLENVVFKVVTIANNTSMSVTPVSDVAVSAKAIRIHSTPGWMMPEYAKHVKYYSNEDVSKPAIRALGIKNAGWVYHKTWTTGAGSVRNIVEPVAIMNDKFTDIGKFKNIIILGDSQFDYAFSTGNSGTVGPAGANTVLAAARDSLFASAGFRGTVTNRAVGGTVLAGIAAAAIAAKAEFISTQGSNLYIVHAGGNDVTHRRPYIQADDYDHFWNHLNAIYDTLHNNGDVCIILPLSKRLYTTAPVITKNDTDTNGSLPYNTNVYYPFFNARCPWVLDENGKHIFDFYEFSEYHQDSHLRVDDGVHPGPGAMEATRTFITSRVNRWAKKITNTKDLRRGSSFIFIPQATDWATFKSNTFVNFFRSNAQGADNQGAAVFAHPRNTAGVHDPFIEWDQKGFVGLSTVASGLGANSLISTDTRFDLTFDGSGHIMSRALYVQGTVSNTAIIRIRGLIEGESGVIKLAGSRNMADNNRQAIISVNGGANNTLNSANNAASNILSVPFVVDANGSINISVTASNTASSISYGYLSALIVDFE